MGTFAETAIVNYRLSFADQGKQYCIFCFPLQQTNSSMWFSVFYICSKQMEFAVFH
jgi:hypothetical protein